MKQKETSDHILGDEEIRELTLWETDEEIAAFREGWKFRKKNGSRPGDEIHARELLVDGLISIPNSQNARVAFERGWVCCNEVRRIMLNPWNQKKAGTP